MPPTENNNGKSSILKSTREAKGLTLDIVHEATKIPMDVLKAIEEGYSVRILSPFYYRGFIKIYAEFLGLDVGQTYKQYGLDQASQSPALAKASVNSARRTPPPNVILGQTQEWVSRVYNPKNVKRIFKIIGFLIMLFLLFRVVGCIASHMHRKVITTSGSLSVTTPMKERKHKVHKYVEENNMVPVTLEVKHESIKAQSEDHKVQVAVRAVRDTWIEVKTDDKVVFQTTLSKGSMESWSADNHIELSGRDLDQLDMEINGKHIGSLGGGERRIRKVLITQEGLTVKK